MTWICLQVFVPADQRESFVSLLWDLETIGIEEGETPEGFLLKAFFAETEPGPLQERFVNAAAQRLLQVQKLELSSFEADLNTWIKNWKKNFRGFPVGRTFYIHPSWEKPPQNYPVPILMEPGHAFGTGTHESTQLSLRALNQSARKVRSMLDVGTGSGILSIAARKLNPELAITAVDMDPEATEVARENFIRNGTGDILLLTADAGTIKKRFELVVANLTAEIFDQIADDLLRVSQKRLLLSGFTENQAQQVSGLFVSTGPFRLTKSWSKNGWRCVQLDLITTV